MGSGGDSYFPAHKGNDAYWAASAVPRGRSGRGAIRATVSIPETCHDRVLRTLAEMENLRRRTEREVSDAKTYGVTSFARDMLTVVDNLSRALEHLPPQARSSADPSTRSLIEGVELTARDLETALGRHGVKKLDPKGLKFDPNFHQAIFEAPDETVPSGTVSQVVQDGWTIGDRVLRPAMVGVSKGGPRAAPRQEPASSDE
jgi:molecular chaperone GrpE